MKKATNSKNRGKIIKLFQITQEHFWKIYEPGAHQTDDVVAQGSGQGYRAMSVVRYGLMEIESVLQRTCYKDKYDIFKFLSCT